MGKPTMWFSNRPDTNRAVPAQKIARGWKFWFYKVEELYYPCSENKCADQHLFFRLCRLLVFPWGGSFLRFLEPKFQSICLKTLKRCLSLESIGSFVIVWPLSIHISFIHSLASVMSKLLIYLWLMDKLVLKLS